MTKDEATLTIVRQTRKTTYRDSVINSILMAKFASTQESSKRIYLESVNAKGEPVFYLSPTGLVNWANPEQKI